MTIRSILLAVPLVVTLVSCRPAEKEQPQASQPEEKQPAVARSPQERLEEIRSALEDVKAELHNRESYNCCIKPMCNWCALHEGECSCFTNLQAGEAVCPDCGLGWHNGKGVIEGVDPKEVRWNITHQHGEKAHKH